VPEPVLVQLASAEQGLVTHESTNRVVVVMMVVVVMILIWQSVPSNSQSSRPLQLDYRGRAG